MKNYTMFNYEFLFGDHFSQISEEARMLYIKMNFYANNGFVANPLALIDSLGYTRDALIELINNGDVLKLEDRSEVFITAYFVHNVGMDAHSWQKTNYYYYWKGKLWIKQNRIATLDPKKEKADDVITNKSNDPEWDAVASQWGFNKKSKKEKKDEIH